MWLSAFPLERPTVFFATDTVGVWLCTAGVSYTLATDAGLANSNHHSSAEGKQSALETHRFCICRFNRLQMENTQGKEIPESSKKQNLH